MGMLTRTGLCAFRLVFTRQPLDRVWIQGPLRAVLGCRAVPDAARAPGPQEFRDCDSSQSRQTPASDGKWRL